MDSPLWIRRMASASIMLTSTVLILGHCSFWTSWGTVLVTTTWGSNHHKDWVLFTCLVAVVATKHQWSYTLHCRCNDVPLDKMMSNEAIFPLNSRGHLHYLPDLLITSLSPLRHCEVNLLSHFTLCLPSYVILVRVITPPTIYLRNDSSSFSIG